MIPTVEWKAGKVRLIDQTKLPREVVYIDYSDYREVTAAIRDLVVRGAPAIGVTAAMGVALGAQGIDTEEREEFLRRLQPVCDHLASARPTAVNLFWAIERMRRFAAGQEGLSVPELKQALIDEADRMREEDIAVNRAMGRYGAEFVPDGATILTHCNAGSLATAAYGTALGVIYAAREQGKKVSVFADETRPILQGARLTAWELMEEGVDVTLITDNMAGHFMKEGRIDLVVVGTDRTVANGDVANKIGTYSVAVLAGEHGIPFYVAAPTSTIDFSIPTGEGIPIEERDPEEVTRICNQLEIAPEGVKVESPAFDVTPARYITAIITEKGAFRPEDLHFLNDPKADLDEVRLKGPEPK
ncbi:MAG: S-methyl-5-thioribose-1-phosphate isomerase [Deltaproteobacteria bacterium]|nr:S-methyl-5-thioribose-1-phosphate isomerase [Deltaproteobacteria bacterium]